MSGSLPRNAELESLNWYHPDLSRHAAESMLLQNGVDGTYLLRPSSKHGQFTLSLKSKESVKHYEVKWNGRQYTFGIATFETFDAFMEHFQNRPIIGGESGDITMLQFAYPRDVSEPPLYGSVTVQGEMGRNRSVKDKPTLNIASKEGFLVKLGGIFKTWKKRWFVMTHNTLKYYKNKDEKEPLRVLDLEECSECAPDESQGREHCFTVVMPWRTFFLCATSDSDRREWMQHITWKLKQNERMKEALKDK